MLRQYHPSDAGGGVPSLSQHHVMRMRFLEQHDPSNIQTCDVESSQYVCLDSGNCSSDSAIEHACMCRSQPLTAVDSCPQPLTVAHFLSQPSISAHSCSRALTAIHSRSQLQASRKSGRGIFHVSSATSDSPKGCSCVARMLGDDHCAPDITILTLIIFQRLLTTARGCARLVHMRGSTFMQGGKVWRITPYCTSIL